MTEEEKQELKALRAKKEELTEEEKARLAELEAKETPSSDEDEFDKAWDDLDDDNTGDDTGESEDSDTNGDQQDQGDDSQNAGSQDGDPSDNTGTQDGQQTADASDSILNNIPDGDQSDGSQANTDGDESGQGINWEKRFRQLEEENQKLVQKMKSWEGRIKAANERADTAEAKLKQGQDKDTTDSDLPDGEDDAVMSEFINEFPDLEKPIKTMIKKEAQKIVDDRLGKVETTVQAVQETVSADAAVKHQSAIAQAHPDYKQIVKSGALNKWISMQPSYLQGALREVVSDGSTEEVIDLLNQYKWSVRPQSKPSPSKDKSQKAKDLEAVPAQSGGPKQSKKIDKDDFDGAWDAEIAKEEKQRR